jgi:hypothetical protein
MKTKNNQNYLIATNLLLLGMIGVSIPTKSLATANPLKGCYIEEKNSLKEIPGYPSTKPQKTLFHELPFRASGGRFIILTKDNKLCYLDMDSSTEAKDKARALKKFSEIHSGAKPIRICEIPASRFQMTCKQL